MSIAVRTTPDRFGPRKRDGTALCVELLRLLGFAVLFACVMVVTAWASGGLPIAGP